MAQDSDSTDTWLGHYRDMLMIRRFEEKAGQLYGIGEIGGFCHLCIGQEAVIVGIEAAARPGDARITGHRCHGHMLAAGIDPARIMAELTGRATGCSGGKGGSMHMAAPAAGFYGGHGITGAHVPIAAGLAFAQRYARSRAITLCSLGDGAAHHGQVAETYDLAAGLDLPILFIIENNGCAPGQDLTPRGTGLVDRAAAHGIPGRVVDGMDVIAVAKAALDAAFEVRAGKGPRLLEMTTYRYRGHAMAAPDKALADAEMRKVRAARDPIEALRQRLVNAGLSEAALKAEDKAIRARIGDAAEAARAAPVPDEAALFTHVTQEV